MLCNSDNSWGSLYCTASAKIQVKKTDPVNVDLLPLVDKLKFANESKQEKREMPGAKLLKKLYKENKKKKKYDTDDDDDNELNITKYTNSINDIIKDLS